MVRHAPLEELEGEDFEVAFMSMMIAHHEGAVDMAEWILERTVRPELRQAAETIMAMQEPEIEQMRRWLQEWHGRDEPDPMMMQMMGDEMAMMMEDMMAGEDPEVAFLTAMIAHHTSAIDMALLVFRQPTRPELRELARNIIVDQAEEIYQFSEWLATW
jgi:uncharacterized protein (DUF305 family)